MVDCLKSIMTPDLLFGIFHIIKFFNNICFIIKCTKPVTALSKPNKTPINKLDINIDKGDFHCDFHLSR